MPLGDGGTAGTASVRILAGLGCRRLCSGMHGATSSTGKPVVDVRDQCGQQPDDRIFAVGADAHRSAPL